MTENPFVFGKTVGKSDFCNRTKDIEFLHQQFNTNTNTILISPRRWGKSSLVEEAARRYTDPHVRFAFIDLFKCRTPEEFYEAYVQALFKATNSRLDEAFQFANKWLKNLLPMLSFQPDPTTEFTVKLQLNASIKEDEILNLAQSIAAKKGIRIIVCIDEFQNVNHFPHPIEFQKKLRGYWQRHDKVHYCLYGSKRHLMTQLFESSDLPFYKFGSTYYLKKIDVDEWVPFIKTKFKKTGKKISSEQVKQICLSMESHSYYTQNAFQILWYISSVEVRDKEIDDSLTRLVEQNELQFQKIIDGLTTYQLNFLKAICKEVKSLHSKETIKTFSLGSTATIQRSIQALLQKDVIDTMGPEITMVDPAFTWWFIRNFLS
jgi:hypothetical protein